MLEIRNLNFTIRKRHIIKGFSYQFQQATYGLLGANGAGKTTLMRCLTGVYPSKTDAIFYNGVAISKIKKYSEEMS